MESTISIGAQRFEDLRTNGYFYVDKTGFVCDWWNSGDTVTLICRPRRFGKTLNLDTVHCFLSISFAGRGEELFGGLEVWNDPMMRELQGTIPVVRLSFASVKAKCFTDMLESICNLVCEAFNDHDYLFNWNNLTPLYKKCYDRIGPDMDAVTCANAIKLLCDLLNRYHKKKPVVLLDEYDTPMEHAWLYGYWDTASSFMSLFMNATFKDNSNLQRGLITGITCISRESIFSDFNNLQVITVLSKEYRTAFGFTKKEVSDSLVKYCLEYAPDDLLADVSKWYGGFAIGGWRNLYNPWSITKFLKEFDGRNTQFKPHWINTSRNELISKVLLEDKGDCKQNFEALLEGNSICSVIDEHYSFFDIRRDSNTIWSLLLSTGYLTLSDTILDNSGVIPCGLRLTNEEIVIGFTRIINNWFTPARYSFNSFAEALLEGREKDVNDYLSEIALACLSSFDSANHPSKHSEPERFYHGLVLGLIVNLRGDYSVKSNRESGFGRYDIMIVPNRTDSNAVIIEFKVFDHRNDSKLEDTAMRALNQINDREYATSLIEAQFDPHRILSYGIAFRGKEVLVKLQSSN